MMSDVPMLAWSNQLMFKTGFQPVIRNARTRKMQHMQGWNLFYPCSYPCVARFLALFECVHCLFRSFTCNAEPVCTEYDMLETGLYTVSMPDQYCWREGTSMLISAMQVK